MNADINLNTTVTTVTTLPLLLLLLMLLLLPQSLLLQLPATVTAVTTVTTVNEQNFCIPTHPTQVRHILTLFSAHWLSTLADRLSPLSMVANPRKAPTRLHTTYEKIQLETVTHPGTNAPNVA